MSEKKFKLRVKDWICLVLAAVLLFGSVAGAILLSSQPDASVKDQTVVGNESEQIEEEEPYNGPVAEISDNVTVLSAEQAERVNKSIRSAEMTNKGLYLEISDGTAMKDLGVGDVFFLNGSKDTPLGEPYFGKVVSVTDRGATDMYCVEAPKIDEVFDQLKIEHSEVLKSENITEIKTVEGVSVKTDVDLDDYFGDAAAAGTVSAENPQGYVGTLAGEVEQAKGQQFLFELKVDILEAFGLKKKEEEDSNRVTHTVQESEGVLVYVADTGSRYHTADCRYVKQSKKETTLGQAAKTHSPCSVCNAPLLKDDDGVVNKEAGLVLEGQFGVKDLVYTVDCEWDIMSGHGLKDLSVDASGTVVANAKVRAFAELELGGRTTTITLPGNCLKLEGLKEKMFPFAFIGYNGGVSIAFGNEQIRAQTSTVPLTIAFILYADVSGKVEIGAELSFDYSQDISYKQTFVKDYKWVFEKSELDIEDPDITCGFIAEVSGDVDFHVGASVGVYVFNLNVLDVALVKVGIDAQGTASVSLTNKTLGDGKEPIFDYDYYIEGYLKLLELRVNIKLQFDIWVTEGSFNYQNTFLLFKHNLFQLGKQNPARYDASSMSYEKLTAKDANAIYYKDTNGDLVRETENGREVLYDEEFFSICGIDETFLYLCVKNETGNLDVYRIKKDGTGGERRIVDNVDICFTNDETYLYFRSSFDENLVQRLNRKDLTITDFISFDRRVRYMGISGDDFYFASGDDGFYFFTPARYYYLVNKDGTILQEYGSNPEISQYYLEDLENYYYASRYDSSGHLYNWVYDVYWLSKDKTQSVKVECISGTGYNSEDVGIFTIKDNNVDGEERYKIILYRGEDGSIVDVTDVAHNRSFFTLCQSDSGDWYFFDQDSDGVTLYSMDSSFQNKTEIKSFSEDEISCNLDDCSMTMMDNRLYFYTMTDDLESAVLYRYDLA